MDLVIYRSLYYFECTMNAQRWYLIPIPDASRLKERFSDCEEDAFGEYGLDIEIDSQEYDMHSYCNVHHLTIANVVNYSCINYI